MATQRGCAEKDASTSSQGPASQVKGVQILATPVHDIMKYDKHGWPTTFRKAGSPAGSWPHTPWWHSTFCDPYERINVWSHLLPGLVVLSMGLTKSLSGEPGWEPVVFYCCCSGATQTFSALTHIWPDDHYLEKLDHLGIAATVVGTPISTIMARHPEESLLTLFEAAICIFVAAFCPAVLRTVAWSLGIAYIYISHLNWLASPHVFVEIGLYAIGAIAFLRNGGHQRWLGLQDHHILHYCATASCFLHLAHLYAEITPKLNA